MKLHRRIVRDRDERGYDLQDVLYRYTTPRGPDLRKITSNPLQAEADIVIPNNRHFENGLAVLVGLPAAARWRRG
ncbi:MAG: hypothetical protein WKG07_24615 [Hymenobacter sp.]